MTSYRIVCVTTEPHHGHIVDVGTGTRPGSPEWRWPVEDVRRTLAAGHSFFTVSPSTLARAGVYADDCPVVGCSVQTIRSRRDAIEDNNLDSLPTCQWR